MLTSALVLKSGGLRFSVGGNLTFWSLVQAYVFWSCQPPPNCFFL
jgi:hypothetical protein